MPESPDRPSHFRILFKVFWLRVVDLEILSPDNDAHTLLGNLAALLAGASVLFSLPLMFIGGPMPQPSLWTFEHLFFATTLTVVGVLAVLSWDSALPDRRDLLVLGSLPIRIRTILAAKISALTGVLGFSGVALNFLTGLVWPPLFRAAGSGIFGAVRSVIAYWITITAIGLFIFCIVLCLQGSASLILPRQVFLRLSSPLQIAIFTVLLGGYFLEPPLENIAALVEPGNQGVLACLPAYWFLGLFQQLNGTMLPAFAPLAERARLALAIVFLSAATTLLLSWLTKSKSIVEQPDLIPSHRQNESSFSPGAPVSRALLQFSVRSLLRSRQHRLFYSFYLSIGMAITVLSAGNFTALTDIHMHTGIPSQSAFTASVMILCFAVLGLRIIIAVPVFLRANWIFQLTQIHPSSIYVGAARHTVLLLAVVPVWITVAILMLSYWPSWQTVVHLLALGLVGAAINEIAMLNLHKLPFACSYLPGKGKLHFLFWGGILVGFPLISGASALEYRLLATSFGSAKVLVLASSLAILLRRYNSRSRQDAATIIFQEEETSDLLALRLNS